jgi:hypothetical protein
MNGKESRIIQTTRTVTERTCQKCYVLRDCRASLYVKNAIIMSGNMPSNGYNDRGNERQQTFAEYNLLVISSSFVIFEVLTQLNIKTVLQLCDAV